MVKGRTKEEKLEELLKTLKAHIACLDNKKRREILKICSLNPMTISELKRKLNSSFKVTYENVKLLEKYGFARLTKKTTEKHQPVYVETTLTPDLAVSSMQVVIDMWREDNGLK